MTFSSEGDEARSPHMFHLLNQKEEVHELRLENSRLDSLLCKLKAVSRWKHLVEEGKLHRQLLQAQQVGSEEKCSPAKARKHKTQRKYLKTCFL